MHHPGKLFPRFLLFAAKNTTALLLCQIISSASSYWFSFSFVSQIEESVICKDTRDFWSFQLHRHQEFTKIQSGRQERWKRQLSTWAFTYKISVKGWVFRLRDLVCLDKGWTTCTAITQGLMYSGGNKPERDARAQKVKAFNSY